MRSAQPDACECSDNLMQFVIRSALLEVNRLSDVNVRIEFERHRARANAAPLSWRRKKGEEFRDVLKGLQRPKAGRRKWLMQDPLQFEPML